MCINRGVNRKFYQYLISNRINNMSPPITMCITKDSCVLAISSGCLPACPLETEAKKSLMFKWNRNDAFVLNIVKHIQTLK